MNRRKRQWISLLLVAVLLVLPLSACTWKPRQELIGMLHQMNDVGPTSGEPVQTLPVAAVEPETSSDETWTVMIYLCGSDLESEAGAATANLNEILGAGWSKQVNVLIETGGSSRWHMRGISSTKLGRYRVTSTGLTEVQEADLSSMGEAETLTDFLNWGMEEAPADKTMVILWNHGGGSVGGACYDEKFWGDSLTLAEMEEGFRAAGHHFDVVGFDCCLMASLETAALLAPYADYLVASQESEPSGGWNYGEWLSYLYRTPGCNGVELGTVICDSYYEKCEAFQMDYLATLSVVDLQNIPAVQNAFKNMAAEMMNTTTDVDTLRMLVQAAGRAESYGGNSYFEGYANMVDLGDLVEQTKEQLPITSQAVAETLERAVLYQIHGSYRDRAHGLSVFYPLGDTEYYADEYCTATDNLSYLRFIDTITDSWDAPDWVYEGTTGPVEVDLGDDIYSYEDYEFIDPQEAGGSISSSDYALTFATGIDEDNRYALQIRTGREILLAIDYDLFYLDEENDRYIYLGSDVDVDVEWESGRVRDNFAGEWVTIGGEFVSPVLIDEGVDSANYAIPIRLNGEETNLRVRYDAVSDAYTIIDTYAGVDAETGMSARDGRPLEDGDEITFLFYGYELDGNELDAEAEEEMSEALQDNALTAHEMGTITYREGSTTMETAELPDGVYLYNFALFDIFGNEYTSDPVIFTIEGESIYVDEI